MLKDELQITIPMTREQRELSDKMTEAVRNPAITAVSFKLFGTLLLLPFSENYDLFLLMEKEFPEIHTAKRTFSELRIDAEAEAGRKFKGQCSPTISQIYDILAKKTKISDELRERLIKRECDIAVSLVFPRYFGKKLFNEAVNSRKKTIIIADTVYPRAFVVRMLSQCGYEACSELIVANEVVNNEKPDESMFNDILDKANVTAKQLLHIGGDVAADVELPIMKGAKALLLSPTAANMLKSGRLRGFVQAKHIYDYDTAEYLALHLAVGLYSAYIFDIPRTKTMHSDFCGNAYILGFMVYGCYKLADFAELTELQQAVVSAMEENPETRRGGEDFYKLFRRHFERFLGRLNCVGFTLPLELLTAHGGSMDIGLLKNNMSADIHKKWREIISDAPTAPAGRKTTEQNKLEKLADRMFPPGTRVRNIADGVIFKMKKKL